MTKRQAAEFELLYCKARLAGLDAGSAARPVPMVVQQHENMMDDNSPVQKEWFVSDGVCGFAWVQIHPGNSPFANWLKKTERARKDSYYGGVSIWVSDFGQSMQRKEAYARAFARVLQDAGIKAHMISRID